MGYASGKTSQCQDYDRMLREWGQSSRIHKARLSERTDPIHAAAQWGLNMG